MIKKSFLNIYFFFQIFVLLSFFTSFFSSCKNKKNTETDTGTLRSEAEQRIKETLWTDAIEKDRLTSQINSIDTIDKSIKITPLIFNNSTRSKNLNKIYPSITGFGSLDISKLEPAVEKNVRTFCDDLIKKQSPDSLFEEGTVFEYSLFLIELKDNWDKELESYVLGEPFSTEDFCEVPVRFTSGKDGFVDVMVFFSKIKENWKINQLKILKTAKTESEN